MDCITINTDAGFCPFTKLGSWAFWIVGNGLFLRGSGVFKNKCKGSTDAEEKAMVNAIHILLKANYDFSTIRHLVFNRDNINAKTHNEELIRRCHPTVQVKFKHVKGHSKKQDARSHVNRWCDEQCTLQLKAARKAEQQRQQDS